MLRDNGKWDIRCPKSVKKLFPDRSKPYYWKVNKDMALRLCKIMSKAYNIPLPEIQVTKLDCNAAYRKGTIFMWPRNHMKSIMHEFYHHLDYSTGGKYNSSDRGGGSHSLAWKFADLWWKKFISLY